MLAASREQVGVCNEPWCKCPRWRCATCDSTVDGRIKPAKLIAEQFLAGTGSAHVTGNSPNIAVSHKSALSLVGRATDQNPTSVPSGSPNNVLVEAVVCR